MEAARQPWPALGVLLVRDGLVSKTELETILEEQRDARHQRISGHQLGELLVARGTVTPTQVARLVAEQYELPFIELDTTDIDLQAARVLSEEITRRLSALPISTRADGSYLVAIADPATVLFSDELRRALGAATNFAVVGPEAVDAAIAFVHDRPHVLPVAIDPPDDDGPRGVVIELRSDESADVASLHAVWNEVEEQAAAPELPPLLGALLQREGLVTDEALDRALAQQRLSTSWRLGEILVNLGLVTSGVVARLIAEQYELPYVELAGLDVDPAVVALLPREIARDFPAVPIAVHSDGLVEVAIADPTNFYYSDVLQKALGVPLTFVVAAPDAIEALLETPHAPLAVVLDSEEEHGHIESVVPVDLADSTVEEVVHEPHDLHEFIADPLDVPGFATAPDHLPEFVGEPVDFPEFVTEPVAVEEPVAFVELDPVAQPDQIESAVPLDRADSVAVEDAGIVVSERDDLLELVTESDQLPKFVGEPVDLPEFVTEPVAVEEPVAFVELDPVAQPDQIESAVPLDRADSVAVEDARIVVSERDDLPELVTESDHLPEFAAEPIDLPEFVTKPTDIEAPVVTWQIAAPEERRSHEKIVGLPPTWATELQLADDTIELAEPQQQDDPHDVLGPTDFVADDLAAALLAEVAEVHENTDPAAEAEQEATLSFIEGEYAERLAETIDQTVDPEATVTLVEVEVFHDATGSPGVSDVHDELVVENPAAYADDLDAAIEDVLALGASAIHFSPQGEWHTVRARIDGLVRELGVVAKADLESLVERVEASTAMRVNVLPTKQGDKVTLFPREQAGSPRTLAELGLASDAAESVHAALTPPFGAIIVCGPIGAGTTTTLYAALEALKAPDRVIASIEDPVERVLDGIDQTEVVTAAGVTFAGGLRTLLDTDTDVVLVGEIRDNETAEVAFQAALDGRHILSAVHAPSAAAAIRRLTDMGLDPGVLGGALTCVVAQRLVRRVCNSCRETYYASDVELADLEQPIEGGGPRLLARGRGCQACDGTGFRGRVGIFEVLAVTDEIRAHVCDGASEKKIQRAAVAAGMRTMRDDGVRLCLEGVTTAAEVQRILGTER